MAGTVKKLYRSKSGMKIIPLKDSERSPFELSEPEWMKDNESLTCLECESKFDFVRRRHHCRRCGKLYCDNCCKTRLSLPRMCFLDPVRLCAKCVAKTTEENDFYNKDLKTLLNGTLLRVSFDDSNKPQSLARCALSCDHCHLLLEGTSHPKLPMYRLLGHSLPMDDENKNGSITGFILEIKGDEDFQVKMEIPAERPPSAASFLMALKKALEMVDEAKAIVGTGT